MAADPGGIIIVVVTSLLLSRCRRREREEPSRCIPSPPLTSSSPPPPLPKTCQRWIGVLMAGWRWICAPRASRWQIQEESLLSSQPPHC
uniref:Uncharacterized protein n=1 Tax=Oryza nivara TaxID=4536 RepID=A0A0E0GZ13_ORYNI